MRNFCLMAGTGISAAAFVIGLALPAQAVSMQGSSSETCVEYATNAADHWAQDLIQRAGDFEQAGSGKVLVIAAGKKYLMPPRQADDRTLGPMPVGERIARYKAVQLEEFNRCTFGMPVNAGTLR